MKSMVPLNFPSRPLRSNPSESLMPPWSSSDSSFASVSLRNRALADIAAVAATMYMYRPILTPLAVPMASM